MFFFLCPSNAKQKLRLGLGACVFAGFPLSNGKVWLWSASCSMASTTFPSGHNYTKILQILESKSIRIRKIISNVTFDFIMVVSDKFLEFEKKKKKKKSK